MASANRGHEDKGDEEYRYGDGNDVEREVYDGREQRCHDEVAIAHLGFLRCEQTLPCHIEPGRPESYESAAGYGEIERLAVNVDGGYEAAPSQKIRHPSRPYEKLACGSRKEIHAQGACEIADSEYERLRKEERHDKGLRLHFHRKKREDPSPDRRGVHGKKKGVAQVACVGKVLRIALRKRHGASFSSLKSYRRSLAKSTTCEDACERDFAQICDILRMNDVK